MRIVGFKNIILRIFAFTKVWLYLVYQTQCTVVETRGVLLMNNSFVYCRDKLHLFQQITNYMAVSGANQGILKKAVYQIPFFFFVHTLIS